MLVGPIKQGNTTLLAGFHRLLFHSTNVRLLAITRPILEEGVRLRASANLKTPDAIHAATALFAPCALLITNDADFPRVPGLNVIVLRDVLTP